MFFLSPFWLRRLGSAIGLVVYPRRIDVSLVKTRDARTTFLSKKLATSFSGKSIKTDFLP